MQAYRNYLSGLLLTIIALLMLAAAGTVAGDETEPFFEDGMETDTGWTTMGGPDGWQRGTPTTGPGEAKSGDSCWATVLHGNYPDLGTGSLSLERELDAGGHRETSLSFWHWYEFQGKEGDRAFVEARLPGEENWQILWSSPFFDDDTVSTDGWEEVTIFLPCFEFTTFTLRFRLISDDETAYAGWYLDDLSLIGLLAPEKDAALIFLEAPEENTAVDKTEDVIISVMVQNQGTEAQSIPVECKIEHVLGLRRDIFSEQTPTLDPGEVHEMEFQWRARGEPGAYTVNITAELAGDEKPLNDDLFSVIWVRGNYDLEGGLSCFRSAAPEGISRSVFANITNNEDRDLSQVEVVFQTYFVYPESNDPYPAEMNRTVISLEEGETAKFSWNWNPERLGNYTMKLFAGPVSLSGHAEDFHIELGELQALLSVLPLFSDTREEGNPCYLDRDSGEVLAWDDDTNGAFWTGDNRTGEDRTAAWHVVGNGFESAKSWYCGIPAEERYASLMDSEIVSQPLDLEGLSDIKLSFVTKFDVEGSIYDNMYVYSSGDGDNWSQLLVYPRKEESNSYAEEGNREGWIFKELTIPQADLTSEFQMSFRFRSDSDLCFKGTWIDDIMLSALPAEYNPVVGIAGPVQGPIVKQGSLEKLYAQPLDDGNLEEYSWKSDSQGFLGDGEELDLDILNPGWHELSLKAQDDQGLWSPKVWANIYINPAPVAQIRGPVPKTAYEGEPVAFLGNWEDIDQATAFLWESDVDGELSQIANFSTMKLSVGKHDIIFKVQDEYGSWSEVTEGELTIRERILAIIDGIGPLAAPSGKTIHFNGHFEGADRAIAYEWSSNVTGLIGEETACSTNELPVGSHEVSFRVRDKMGFWSQPATSVLEIYQPAQAEIISLDPGVALEGRTVSFVGGGSAEDGITAYSWESDLDGEFYNGSEDVFSTTDLSPGEHTISLNIRDDNGFWGDATSSFLIVHQKPEADIVSIFPSPASPTELTTFTASGSDDGEVNIYSWESDIDGELYNGSDSSFFYTGLSEGGHGITLLVMDDLGAWSSPVTIILEIIAPNERPTVSISVPSQGEDLSKQVTISGRAEDPEDGLVKVEISFDGNSWRTAEGTEHWSFFWDTSGMENGNIRLRARSFDGEHYSEEVTIDVTVSNKDDDGDSPGFELYLLIPGLLAALFIFRRERQVGRP